MTTDQSNSASPRRSDQLRFSSAMFPETGRGVQAASEAFDDGRHDGADATERARAWQNLVLANLL